MIPGIPEPDWSDALTSLPPTVADHLALVTGNPGCGAQVAAELGQPAADRGPLGQFAARALAAAWALDGAVQDEMRSAQGESDPWAESQLRPGYPTGHRALTG